MDNKIENKFSWKIKELKPSATLLINKKVAEMKAAGEEIINLSVGEPDFGTPDFIKDSAIKAINEGFTRYTDSSGIRELREAICKKFFHDNNLVYTPEQVVVSNGAKHSLFNIFLAICDEGDEVIIPRPYWVSYPEMVKITGGKPVLCRFDDKYRFDIEHFKSLVNKNTKAVILNSPSNPSGMVYSEEELKKIGEIVLKNQILCISDEVYEYFIYGGNRHISIASLGEELKNLTIVVNGVSKTFSMTGWRIGYLAAPLPLAKIISDIQSQTTSNPSSVSQKAALAAIFSNPSGIAPIIREFETRRNFIVENLDKSIKFIKPEGAFYLLLKVENLNSLQLSKKLLEEEKIATVPGNDFGIEGFVRISFAVKMETLKEAIARINKLAKKYDEKS
ncbi:MAG: pyridoxal phosphate-dependent aminotransferase [Actinobacteria bacterium]|nr:pyridoxal phosphate-dependent aminotransferase [Actinomycetota bacterium]MCL5674965.1 pyridoxal phosphate-dependent aminotransferase [Candidatus Omnitrophota bacterium]